MSHDHATSAQGAAAQRRRGLERTQDFLEAVDQGRQELAAAAQTADELGTLREQTLATLARAGGWRLGENAEIGAEALVRAAAGLGRHHPSAAWNCMVSVTNSLLAQQFARTSGWAAPDPDSRWCGVFMSPDAHARRGERGTHRIHGTWRYASNSDHAQWALLNVDHAELGPCFVIVDRGRLQVQQQWSALGLRATGSHTLGVAELDVPADQLLGVDDLYREDPTGAFGLRTPARLRTAFALAGVGLGAAQALLEAVVARLSGSPAGPRRELDPGSAVAVGDTSTRLSGARCVLLQSARALDDAAESGEPIAARSLADARAMLGRAVRDVADTAHELSLLAGTRACLNEDVVGRLWRDVHIATRHGALTPAAGFRLRAQLITDPDFAPTGAGLTRPASLSRPA